MKKAAIVVGARPNFIKLFPLVKALDNLKSKPFHYDLIHTGQHYDHVLSGSFFEDLSMPEPNVFLNVAERQHTTTMANTIRAFDKYLENNKVSKVIVFGDVNSTVACAVSASHLSVPAVHIEAGLRSFDRTMPEEINRTITDHISDQLFCSEKSAIDNLKNEGLEKNVFLVGNIMIDTLIHFREKAEHRDVFSKLKLEKSKFILVTIHRQENVDNPHRLERILSLLSELSPEFPVVFPIHPRTVKNIQAFKLEKYLSDINVIDPQGYLDFLCLQMNSLGVVTDSGGVQEETTFLNKPCVTLRSSTERPVTIELGTNILMDIETTDLLKKIRQHLGRNFKDIAIPYWDGKVAERIIKFIDV